MSCDISKSALHRHRQHLTAVGTAEPAQILSAANAPTVANGSAAASLGASADPPRQIPQPRPERSSLRFNRRHTVTHQDPKPHPNLPQRRIPPDHPRRRPSRVSRTPRMRSRACP
jgi:hypothetical protein